MADSEHGADSETDTVSAACQRGLLRQRLTHLQKEAQNCMSVAELSVIANRERNRRREEEEEAK